MKTFLPVLVLLALTAGVPAFATEKAPLPVSSPSAVAASHTCASTGVGAVLNPQVSEPPSWLAAEPSSGFNTANGGYTTSVNCNRAWCIAVCGGFCVVNGSGCVCS
jgi:hypothetical protein